LHIGGNPGSREAGFASGFGDYQCTLCSKSGGFFGLFLGFQRRLLSKPSHVLPGLVDALSDGSGGAVQIALRLLDGPTGILSEFINLSSSVLRRFADKIKQATRAKSALGAQSLQAISIW
jgi:hypothetical protein